MHASLAIGEWKGEETTGKHSQVPIPGCLAKVELALADEDFIRRASWEGAIRYAVQRSGKDDFEIADDMPISHGYMSKVLKGVAGLYGRRLVKFMQITGSVAPLQWMADQVGYELKKKAPMSKEEQMQRRIEDLERQLRRQA